MTFDEGNDEPEEEEKEGKKVKKGKKTKEVEIDPEELERRRAVAAKAADIAKYGVSFEIHIFNFAFYRELGFGKTTLRKPKLISSCGWTDLTLSPGSTYKSSKISKTSLLWKRLRVST